MNLENIKKQLAGMAVGELRNEFQRVMGYPSRSRNRQFLIRKILWGKQAQVLGDLPSKMKEDALSVADVRDVTTALPKVLGKVGQPNGRRTKHRLSPTKDSRLPVPGSILTREYQGREIRVYVHADDFEFEGRTYRSLSAVAKAVTGTNYNGFLFFKLS